MTHQTHRRRRRHSAVCHRHPISKPQTGFCATCLRERLSVIESLSSDQVPELRRVPSDNDQPRRRSCDVIVPDEEDEHGEKKTMKELIDLESRTHGKDLTEISSVLSRTLKKLSLKLGPDRRSCDVDTKLLSFEEPRASWDGCLTEKTHPKLVPLSSVSEDAKDPGGTAQTRDYYFDSRRRRSFGGSLRHGLLEVDDDKLSPEAVGLFHGAKLLVTEKELRDSNWYSKSYKPESLELASKGVGCVDVDEVKQTGKKKWAKGWNLWGLIQRKGDAAKNEIKTEQSLKLGGDAVEGSLAESLLKLRRVARGESNGDVSEKLIRSYSVSARKSCDGIVNGFQGGRSSCDGLFHGSAETGGRRSLCEDELFHKPNHLIQRDAKLETYSPENLRNGMVRFYLTPLKSHKLG